MRSILPTHNLRSEREPNHAVEKVQVKVIFKSGTRNFEFDDQFTGRISIWFKQGALGDVEVSERLKWNTFPIDKIFDF